MADFHRLWCTQAGLRILFNIMTLYTMQVKRHFSRCQIVGSRFPIALVHWGGTVLEVSSFGTRAKRDTIPTDAAALLSWPPPHSKARLLPLHGLLAFSAKTSGCSTCHIGSDSTSCRQES